eukprot:CAMPEP_0177596734 /NCGR_PEP_ID=MMETSP0419_2-20121207/11288_1 /TAXON_ID=582737 /ORGANISM="Tetraselmis sp., Strain GSL018" /LENGTH=276 /DNA_ID=CAMNT_0019088761 /DNA_START=139 /DNA_END=969 /DNA_ORIENTATION=-
MGPPQRNAGRWQARDAQVPPAIPRGAALCSRGTRVIDGGGWRRGGCGKGGRMANQIWTGRHRGVNAGQSCGVAGTCVTPGGVLSAEAAPAVLPGGDLEGRRASDKPVCGRQLVEQARAGPQEVPQGVGAVLAVEGRDSRDAGVHPAAAAIELHAPVRAHLEGGLRQARALGELGHKGPLDEEVPERLPVGTETKQPSDLVLRVAAASREPKPRGAQLHGGRLGGIGRRWRRGGWLRRAPKASFRPNEVRELPQVGIHRRSPIDHAAAHSKGDNSNK